MSSIKNAIDSIIRNQNNNFCCLCFASIVADPLDIEENISISLNGSKNNIPMLDILHLILGKYMHKYIESFDSVCRNCATAAINSYIFIETCTSNAKLLNQTIDQLTKSVECQTDEIENCKSLYITINVQDLTTKQYYIETKTKSSQEAVKRLRFIDSYKSTHKIGLNKFNVRKKIIVQRSIIKKNNKKVNRYIPIPTSEMLHDKNSDLNICKECLKEFPNSGSLRNHYIRVHAPKLFKCSICPKKYGSMAYLQAHRKESHCTVICTECGKVFNNRHTLRVHEVTHFVSYICPDCGRVYKNKTTFKQHKDLDICGRKLRASPSDAQLTCDYCNKKYTQKVSLRVHIQHEHGNYKAHVCEWCGKRFWAQSRLKAHAVKHTKEKNFVCSTCGRKFVTKESLLYHTRIHTGEKPYPCMYCSSKFLSSSRRADHIKRHHSNPTFQCDICFSKFNSQLQLQKHKKTHFDIDNSETGNKEINVKYVIGAVSKKPTNVTNCQENVNQIFEYDSLRYEPSNGRKIYSKISNEIEHFYPKV